MSALGNSDDAQPSLPTSAQHRRKTRSRRTPARPASRDLSVSYNKLPATSLTTLGSGGDAQRYFNKRSTSPKNSLAQNPSAPTTRDLSVSYNKLGDLTDRTPETATTLNATSHKRSTSPKNSLAQNSAPISQRPLRLSTTSSATSRPHSETATTLNATSNKRSSIAEKLARAEPQRADCQRPLHLHERLGDLADRTRKRRRRSTLLQQALNIQTTSLAPQNPARRLPEDLSVSHTTSSGELSIHLGNGDDAQRPLLLMDLK